MCYAMKIEAGMITGDEKLRDEALAEGLKNHPYAFMIRLQYLQALTPRWGGSYQEMQKFIDECRKFSDENPRLNELSASIPADKGRSYRFLGKNEDAIKMYDEALKISKMPVYYAERGDVYMQLQDFKSALADYEQALSLCPNDPDYLERKGKAASSIKNLSRLMKMNPGQKGFISNNTAEDDESLISERQKAIEHAKKGTTEMRAARFTSAIAEFSESIRLAPGEFVPYYSRGICYQQINNLDAALRDFQSAVERKPDEIGLQFRIARIYADRNMLNEAMNTLDIIISSDPRNGEAYFLRSRINERMGNNVNALDDMRQACDLEYQPACRYYKQVK
jgi:tetratricopeptide (TPR) repeat protein